MAGPFLATITLHQDLSAPVDPGYGIPAPPAGSKPPGVVMPPIYYPPVISGGPGSLPPYPAHPIAPGGSPPGIWGPTDPRPTPPIVIPEPPGGGPPLVIWGPPGPWPTPPIVIPMPPIDAHPEHPIVIPPDAPPEGEKPPGIWGPLPGFPTPPIVIPPTDPDRQKLITWTVQWSPIKGWQVVGIPNVPHPAPASTKA